MPCPKDQEEIELFRAQLIDHIVNYGEVGSGGGDAGGCVPVSIFYSQVTAFGIGDTLYNVAKARRGVLEKVVVKSIRTILTRRTLAAGKTLYVDTFNGLWNEWDLVPLGKAVSLVVAYRQKLADEASKLYRC